VAGGNGRGGEAGTGAVSAVEQDDYASILLRVASGYAHANDSRTKLYAALTRASKDVWLMRKEAKRWEAAVLRIGDAMNEITDQNTMLKRREADLIEHVRTLHYESSAHGGRFRDCPHDSCKCAAALLPPEGERNP
jgi:hypothetical protein